MGDEDLYVGNVRTYYNTQSIILSSNERPSLKLVVVVFLMVKLNVEKVDVELLEEERVDYDTM